MDPPLRQPSWCRVLVVSSRYCSDVIGLIIVSRFRTRAKQHIHASSMSAATNAMQLFDQDAKKFGTQFCRSHLDAREL